MIIKPVIQIDCCNDVAMIVDLWIDCKKHLNNTWWDMIYNVAQGAKLTYVQNKMFITMVMMFGMTKTQSIIRALHQNITDYNGNLGVALRCSNYNIWTYFQAIDDYVLSNYVTRSTQHLGVIGYQEYENNKITIIIDKRFCNESTSKCIANIAHCIGLSFDCDVEYMTLYMPLYHAQKCIPFLPVDINNNAIDSLYKRCEVDQ